MSENISKKVVYLATPISINPDCPEAGKLTPWAVFTNCIAAHLVARRLWKSGLVVISPASNTMFMDGADIESNTYYYGDLEIVKRCDAVFLNKGWEDSKGCNLERNFAIENNIPVFTDETELLRWANENFVPVV